MRWIDRTLGRTMQARVGSGAADRPWAEIDGFALVIIDGVATAHGRTTNPVAKLEVLQQIARCEGVTSICDCVTLRATERALR